MQLRFHCPTDMCVAIIEYEPLDACEGSMTCPRCKLTHPITVSDTLRRDNKIDRCAVCKGSEFFIRKDFPQALGVAVVVVFGLAAIYYFSVSVLISWSILAVAAAIDLVIYATIGKVTTCYACRAQYRKGNLNPAHEGFDLATSEKY